MSEKLVKQNTAEASGNQLHNTTRSLNLGPAKPNQQISHNYRKSLTLLFQTHIVPLQLLAGWEA
jgi:hypothetical protein